MRANRTSTLLSGIVLSAAALAAAALVMTGGCDVLLPEFPIGKLPSDTGRDFDAATLLQLDANGSAVIAGTIAGDEAAVYDLGPCDVGDRIIATVDPAAGSPLDPTMAVFNEDGEVLALNDDVDLAAGLIGSHIDEIVSTGGDHYYLAVSKFYFDMRGGNYEGTVHVERDGVFPQPPTQYLLLNFAGGSVTLPNEGTIEMDAFDAADIDPVYIGKTNEIKAKIEETVRQNFEDTGIQIVTSDDPAPEPGTFSTVYFGGFSTDKFGLAESVDQGNLDRCDDGIVFTNNFDDPFAHQPTPDGIAVAIGNVASHEAGHLLGLNHVADITALMDSTGTASTLLADQEFKTAPFHRSIFPIGSQNAPMILDRVVPK